jgi:hypothetical protein
MNKKNTRNDKVLAALISVHDKLIAKKKHADNACKFHVERFNEIKPAYETAEKNAENAKHECCEIDDKLAVIQYWADIFKKPDWIDDVYDAYERNPVTKYAYQNTSDYEGGLNEDNMSDARRKRLEEYWLLPKHTVKELYETFAQFGFKRRESDRYTFYHESADSPEKDVVAETIRNLAQKHAFSFDIVTYRDRHATKNISVTLDRREVDCREIGCKVDGVTMHILQDSYSMFNAFIKRVRKTDS